MRRQAATRITCGLISIAATAVAAAAPAGVGSPPSGPALAPRTHGFMLYLSQPIGGGGGSMRPKFGFRIEQVRMMGNSGAPDAGDPVQHRALVGWQMEGLRGMNASDMKVELGGRMTYDVRQGAFSAQLSRPASAAAPRPAAFNRSDAFNESKLTTPFRPANESTAMFHDIAAAAIGTFRSSHPLPAAQRPVPAPRPSSMRETN